MPTIIDIIETQFLRSSNTASFTFYDENPEHRSNLTLAELRCEALKIAALLSKAEPVLILQTDPLEFIKSFFGSLYAGAIAVPLASPIRKNGLERLHTLSKELGARRCLTSEQDLSRLRKRYGQQLVGKEFNWITVDSFEYGPALDPDVSTLPRPDQPALIQFTSGSTGNPKGVMISHGNIVENSKLIKGCFRNDPDSVSVCWLPPHHDMGLIDGIIQPVFTGFHGVIMTPARFLQRPVRWLRAMSEFGATYSGGPNFSFDYCSERISDDQMHDIDLSSLQSLYNGSERVQMSTLQRFTDRFSRVGFSMNKFVACYGLAEATLAVTASDFDAGPVSVRVDHKELKENRVRLDCDETGVDIVGCGKPLGETELLIINPLTLSETPHGEIGEICIFGKSVANGYQNTSDGTSFLEFGGRKFLRTGDLGFVIGGELFVTGRIKDVIIIRGKNHDPSEIENTCFGSHHALSLNGASAFSVEIEGVERLVVIQEARRTFVRRFDFENVIDSIASDISENHELAPYDIAIIPPGMLPKTTSGKIQRRKCKEMWQSNKFETIASLRSKSEYQNA